MLLPKVGFSCLGKKKQRSKFKARRSSGRHLALITYFFLLPQSPRQLPSSLHFVGDLTPIGPLAMAEDASQQESASSSHSIADGTTERPLFAPPVRLPSTALASTSASNVPERKPFIETDERVYFDKQSGHWRCEIEEGGGIEEVEWDADKRAWIPVLDDEIVRAQQAAYSVVGVDEEVRSFLFIRSIISRLTTKNNRFRLLLSYDVKRREAEMGKQAALDYQSRPNLGLIHLFSSLVCLSTVPKKKSSMSFHATEY